MNLFDRLNNEIKKKRCTLLGVGPMTKNVVDASINIANKSNFPLILIASRRQIECNENGSGYVENWDTETFSEYVKSKTKNDNLILARDHGGPWQGNFDKEKNYKIKDAMNAAKVSFMKDIDCGFKIIHIDPSIDLHKKLNQDEILNRVFELYEFCCDYSKKKNKEVLFEIGTEEQSGTTTSDYDLEYTLDQMKNFCDKKKLPFPSFVVIQAGTKVLETENVGTFELPYRIDNEIPVEIQLLKSIDICNKYNILMKEHNTDYLTTDSLNWHPKLGIHSANVAPEFGVAETREIIKLFEKMNMNDEKQKFLKISYNSLKWKKWLKKNSKTSFFEKSIISGHYILAKKENKELLKNLEEKMRFKKLNLNKILQKKISETIFRYISSFRLK